MRPDIRLEGPGGAALMVERHKDLGNALEIDKTAFLGTLRGILRHQGVDFLAVDGAVDNHMPDMDAERAKFLGGGLCEVTKATLGGGESGEALAAPHAGGGAGEEQRALTPRAHLIARLAREEKGTEGTDTPATLEEFRRHARHLARHVVARIIDGERDGTDVLGRFPEIDDLRFVRHVAKDGRGLSTPGADITRHGFKFFHRAAGDDDMKPLARDMAGGPTPATIAVSTMS